MTNYVTGDTIRYLHEHRHLTQRELAERLNVSDKTISKWETSRGLPDITLLEPLASTLSVSVADCFPGNISKTATARRTCKRAISMSALFAAMSSGRSAKARTPAVV